MSIIHPTRGEFVNLHDDVVIHTRETLEAAQEVWVLIRFSGQPEKWYPQGPCEKIRELEFNCRQFQFGEKDMIGQAFQIVAEIVDSGKAGIFKSYYATGFNAATPPVVPVSTSAMIEVRRN